jgi:type IV pilus assembly protein PilA
VGKARESDATIKLGSIARSQQAYHFEKGTFAPSVLSLTVSSGILSSYYYTFPDPSSVSDSVVKHQAVAINPSPDQVRDYAIGVYFNAGAYTRSTCQGADVGDVVDAPNTAAGACTNGGKKLE